MTVTTELQGLVPERIAARIDQQESCWEWRGARTPAGYGHSRYDGGEVYTHRLLYELLVGPIPDGLVIDHLCRNPPCCNPDHLEPVTAGENIRRGLLGYEIRTQCKNGHDITVPENVYTAPNGNRRCRVCASVENDRRTAERRARGDLRKVLQTHCIHGHPFDEANTWVSSDGRRRRCRACDRERQRRYDRAKRAGAR